MASRAALLCLLGVGSILVAAHAAEVAPAASNATQKADSTELAEVQAALQNAKEGSVEIAALWQKARKHGLCIMGKMLVECNKEQEYPPTKCVLVLMRSLYQQIGLLGGCCT